MKEKKQINVWMVYLESNDDGEMFFNVIPCASLKKAREILKNEKEWILKESLHFGHYTPEEIAEKFEVEESNDRFFIYDTSDDYWEDCKIVRKRILK